MRKLGLALSLLAALGLCVPWAARAQVGPPNTIQCNQFVSFTGTGAVATILAGKAGQIIVICGWHVTSTSSTTTTFQLSMGSAANCGGGTNITPALNVTITAPSADHVDFASLSLPTNQNLCVNAPAAITGGIWAAQF